MAAQEAQVLHFTPGRIRIKHSKVKDNAAFAEEIQRKLSSVSGVSQVKANPLTGSVLVLFDDQRVEPPSSLLDMGQTLDLFPENFDVSSLSTGQQIQAEDSGRVDLPNLAEVIDGLFAILNGRVAKATGGVADLKELIPLALSLLGFVKALRSKPASIPWHSYFWYAFGIYRSLHAAEGEPEVDGEVD